MQRLRVLGWVSLWIVAGCGGGGSPATDAGAQVDTGIATDAGEGLDAASPDGGSVPDTGFPLDVGSAPDAVRVVDAYRPLLDGGASPAEIAACHAIAATVAADCNGQADRTCEHTTGAGYCDTERADVLAAAYQCLHEHSVGTGSCRTFSDPSGAETCLADVAAAHDVTHATAVATLLHDRCSSSTPVEQYVQRSIVPLMALSDATLDRMEACMTAAADCETAANCYLDEYQVLFACYG